MSVLRTASVGSTLNDYLGVWGLRRCPPPRRFSINQVLGAVLVVAGAVIAAASRQPGAAASADMRYVLVALTCFAFPAAASCIKERVFRSARSALGRPLNIFVVNAFGSLAQAGFVLLLLPASAALHGLSMERLPEYVAQGSACLMGGAPSCGVECSGAPLLPLLYVAANLVRAYMRYDTCTCTRQV